VPIVFVDPWRTTAPSVHVYPRGQSFSSSHACTSVFAHAPLPHAERLTVIVGQVKFELVTEKQQTPLQSLGVSHPKKFPVQLLPLHAQLPLPAPSQHTLPGGQRTGKPHPIPPGATVAGVPGHLPPPLVVPPPPSTAVMEASPAVPLAPLLDALLPLVPPSPSNTQMLSMHERFLLHVPFG
jgi:hypothetical protein